MCCAYVWRALAAVGLVCAILFAEWCAPRAGVRRSGLGAFACGRLQARCCCRGSRLCCSHREAFATYPTLLLSLPTVTRFGLVLALVSGVAMRVALRLPLLAALDAVAPAVLLFAVFLHLGSFFAGTDLGSGTTLALGSLVPGDEGHHPVALYAACCCWPGCVVLRLRCCGSGRPGMAFGTRAERLCVGPLRCGRVSSGIPFATGARAGLFAC